MKEIVNGRMFNTVNAIFVGSDGYSCSSDFQYWREELYQKRNGMYFLYGEGGPTSSYALDTGLNDWAGGKTILPMDADEAKEWAAEHLDADRFIEDFGESGE